MAIAYDASQSTSSATGATSITSASMTVAASTYLVVGVMCAGSSPATPTAVKFGGSGGTSMTQIGSSQSIGPYVNLSVWGLYVSGGGSGTLYASWAGSQDERAIGGISFTGVASGTSTRTPAQTQSTTTGPATINATSVADDWVVDVVAAQYGGGSIATLTVGAGQTARVDIDSIGGYENFGMSHETATGVSTTMSWTYGSANIDDWGIIAVPLIPAAPAAAPSSTPRGYRSQANIIAALSYF